MPASRARAPQETLFPEESPTQPREQPPSDTARVDRLPSIAAVEVRDRALRSLSDGELKPIKHPVELASITPLIGKLGFLSRKLWEFLVSYALTSSTSIKSTHDGACWRVSTSVLKRDSAFTSNDTRYFKEAITELQKTLVSWSSSAKDKNGEVRPWSSTQLLGSVEFVIDASGRHCVEWSFTPVLLKQLREHEVWFTSELSLVSRMRRHSTLALYKLVCRYATLPGGHTPRLPWRTYIPVLTGDPDPDGETRTLKRQASLPNRPKYQDWRYFNRDVVSKAVAELNSLQQEFWVQPVTHTRVGLRAVEELQFKITRRDGYTRPAPTAAFSVDMEAVSALVSHGIQSKLAQELCSEHGSDRVLKVISHTTDRLADQHQSPLKNVAGFIISELRRTAAPDVPPVQPTVEHFAKDLETARGELTQQLRSHLLRKVRDSWPTMTDARRRELLDRFESEVLPSAPQSIRRLWDPLAPLDKAVISGRFFNWLASTTEPAWNPSDATLLMFKTSPSSISQAPVPP